MQRLKLDVSTSSPGSTHVPTVPQHEPLLLDYAIKDAKIKANPCQGVELPSPEMLFLTAAEVRLLAAALDDRSQERARHRDRPPPYGLLLEFAAFTGLRAGETAALRVGHVDLRAGTAFINRSVSVVKGVRIEGEPKTRAGTGCAAWP